MTIRETTNASEATEYFVDRHSDEGRSDKVAFLQDGRKLSYGELKSHSDRMVTFYKRIGISRENRVALLILDRLEFPIIFWGSLKAGIIPVCLNTLLSTQQYSYILADCRARVLFVSVELYPTIAPLLCDHATLEHVFVVGGTVDGQAEFEPAFATCTDGVPVDVSPDETAFWLYSSGSTGMPKGVMHVHSSLRESHETFGRQVLGIREDDIVFSAAKLFFAYGLGNAMTFPMAVGATTILFPGRPTPQSISTILSEHRPTIFFGVPTLFAAMLADAEGLSSENHNLRLCVSAGEALPKDIGERWKSLTNVDILDGVGSTEMLHIFLSNTPGDVEYGTSGMAVPGYDVRLVNETDDDVQDEEVGELLVRGNTAAAGYWNQRDKSRRTFLGQWTRTGDKYTRRADGRHIYRGRTDDMFKVSGIWVSPFEVESALITHEAVLEAAVVPQSDADGLTKPKAFVILVPDMNDLGGGSGGQSFDETHLFNTLKEHVKSMIGQWKYPRWIEFVAELPKTATGKIQRYKLRN
ncbi:MAG: benzoate-CoA ligase family protein [Hyphomicrobiaceae bacterium]